MAEPNPVPPPAGAPHDAVARCAGGSYWTVSGCGWGSSTLPEEYAALLAPPIEVGAVAAETERVTAPPPAPRPPPAPPSPPALLSPPAPPPPPRSAPDRAGRHRLR